MSPRPPSVKMRRLTFMAHKYQHPITKRWVMDCHVCGGVIEPAIQKWEADHVTPRADGGSDDVANLAPICAGGKGSCHGEKTAKDVSMIAKGKRQSDSVYGVKRPSSSLKKPDGMKYDWGQKRYVRID